MQRKIARLLACPVVIGLLLLSPLGCTRPKLPMPVLVSPVMKLDSYQAPLLPGPELTPQAESLLTDRTLTARGGLEPAPRSTGWSASAPASGLIATPLTDATGWKVEAASEQVAHLGQFDLVGPTGLYWVAGELALFRWLTKETHAVTLLDTKTGQSVVLEDYKEIHSVSPGGRYALLQRRDGSGIAVVNTQLGTERWRIPPNLTVFEWLTDHEFEIYQSDGAGIANAETGAVTNYRGRVMDAEL